MGKEITIDDEEVTFEKVMQEFYEYLTPETAQDKFEEFKEYVNKAKGMNMMREGVIDHLLQQVFFAGAYFHRKYPEKVVDSEYDPEEDEEDYEEEESFEDEEVKNKDDVMFG